MWKWAYVIFAIAVLLMFSSTISAQVVVAIAVGGIIVFVVG